MRFIVSLAEQGFGSLLTFAINLWLIRNGAVESYGVYVFWLAVAGVLGTAQGTLVLAHLYRLPSARDRMDERREPERLLLSFAIGITLASAIIVTLVDVGLAFAGSELASPGAVAFIPAFLLFQYTRSFAFSRQRPVLAACLTGGVLSAAAVLLGGDFLFGFHPDAERVLFLTSAAYGGCSLLILLILLNGMRPMLSWAEISRYVTVLRGSGWLALGAASGEVTNRLYSFAVVGRYGTSDLAALSAVQVVIRPAWMLSAAWSSIGYPQMSARFAEHDRGGFLRVMLTGATLSTAGSFLWSAMVLAAWPWISGVLYHGRYQDVGPLVYFWGANVMLGSVALALNMAILVMGEFKHLALIDMVGAIVTTGAIFGLMGHFNYTYAVVATMMGQTMQIALMAGLLQNRLRRPASVLAQRAAG
jgi:O-antigen/teichoic acid export membrane protein